MLQEEKIQSSPFHEVAQKLLEKGIISIPLVFADKRPVPHGWQNFTKENIKYYLSNFHETSNVGVVLGKASGLIALDFDNNVAGLHNKILNLCGRNTVVKKGNNGGTLFFRYNGEKPKKWKAEGQMVLELLSDGNQTVIPPSIHPKSQKPYVYTRGDLLTTPLEEIPFLPANFLLEVDKLFGVDNDLYSGTTLDQVKDALNFLEPSNYDDWLAVGMALKNDFEAEGFEVWNDWSAKSTNYVEKEMQYKWKSFNKDGLTCATIFKKAIEKGFKPSKNVSSLYNIKNLSLDLRKYKQDRQHIGLSLGIKALDNHWHMRPKELSIVTGIPNSGKSEFLDFLMYKAVTNHNQKIMYVSFEKMIVEHLDSFVHRFCGKNLEDRTEEEEAFAITQLQNNIFFYDHTNQSRRLPDILDKVQEVHNKIKLNVLVVDPYSFLAKLSDNEYTNTNQTVIALSDFAKKNKMHVFLIAHPRTVAPEKNKETGEYKPREVTMYDISGGANWFNTCDNAFIVHRDNQEVEIELAKIRRQEIDSVGRFSLKYVRRNRSYETIKTDY